MVTNTHQTLATAKAGSLEQLGAVQEEMRVEMRNVNGNVYVWGVLQDRRHYLSVQISTYVADDLKISVFFLFREGLHTVAQ